MGEEYTKYEYPVDKAQKGKGKYEVIDLTSDASEEEEEASEEESGNNGKRKKKNSGEGKSTKKRVTTGIARRPSTSMLKYSTTHYTLFDPVTKLTGPPIKDVHHTFAQYDDCLLVMVPSLQDAKLIPVNGVRLDDMHVAIVLESGLFSKKQLTANWQGEFDKKGMTRASRVPLGHAAKVYKTVGDTDIDGQTIGKGEEGYYYLWHRGLQMLGGQESINAGMYLQRPSFEKDRCTGTTWKKSHKAAIQFLPGDRRDQTFSGMNLPHHAFLGNPVPSMSTPAGRRGLETVPKTNPPVPQPTNTHEAVRSKHPQQEDGGSKKDSGNKEDGGSEEEDGSEEDGGKEDDGKKSGGAKK